MCSYFNGAGVLLSACILPIIAYMNIRTLCLLITYLFLTSPVYAEEAQNETVQPASSGAAPSMSEKPRTEPNPNIARISDLLKIQDPITEVLHLDTGKDNEKLLAFYRSEGSGIKQGGIILFPDTETHTDWPDGLSELRKGLSDFGWYTLSIYLPSEKRPEIPERTLPVLSSIKPQAPASEAESTETGEGAEEPQTENTATEAPTSTENTETQSSDNSDTSSEQTNDETKADEKYEEQIYRLGTTAYNHLNSEAGVDRLIILGVGTGAVWAAKYVEKFQAEQDLRLVMIDARQPISTDAPDLLEILPNLAVTIIDLHHSPQFNSRDAAAQEFPGQRLRLARHKRMNAYHQSRLPAQPVNWKSSNTRLLKHTRGLINTYIIKAEQEQRNIKLNNDKQADSEKAPG